MIQGISAIIYRDQATNKFVSAAKIEGLDVSELHIHIDTLASNGDDEQVVDLEKLKKWRPSDYNQAEFVLEDDGKFLCIRRSEKMGKRYHNTVNPNDIVARYGADTLRLYIMFLGPLEQSKPWATKGIDGTSKFLKNFGDYSTMIKAIIW